MYNKVLLPQTCQTRTEWGLSLWKQSHFIFVHCFLNCWLLALLAKCFNDFLCGFFQSLCSWRWWYLPFNFLPLLFNQHTFPMFSFNTRPRLQTMISSVDNCLCHCHSLHFQVNILFAMQQLLRRQEFLYFLNIEWVRCGILIILMLTNIDFWGSVYS